MALGGSWPMTTARPPTPTSVDGSLDRHADQSGGGAPGGQGRFIPRFHDPVTTIREQANGNEQTIQHDRTPWYDSDYMTSNHDTLVNWTDCGPIRPSLHMRNTSVNRQVGTSNTRNFDPRPITMYGTQDQGHGMHTNPAQPKTGVNKNFRARQQQQPARINRLSPSVRSGQSFSQTTTIQGGAR